MSLVDQRLPVFWLPEMLTAHVTSVLVVCVMTFEHCSGKRYYSGRLQCESKNSLPTKVNFLRCFHSRWNSVIEIVIENFLRRCPTISACVPILNCAAVLVWPFNWPRNVVQRGIFYANLCLSVCSSVSLSHLRVTPERFKITKMCSVLYRNMSIVSWSQISLEVWWDL